MKRAASKSGRRAAPARQSSAETNTVSSATPRATTRWHQTLLLALASSVLLWAALPPLDAWPLAWLAPVPWLLLCRQTELAGRRPYAAIWLAGFLFWLAALHWIRLPHPANYIGWLALACYLACYIPVFIGLTRVAVHRWKWPIAVAAPVVWTALELVRGHLLTGFTMASLGHTQYRWIELIQVADFAGAYGVSFVVMCGAACMARMLPVEYGHVGAWLRGRFGTGDDIARRAPTARIGWGWLRPLGAIAALLAATLSYGYWRLSQPVAGQGPRIALIQGSTDTELKSDPTKNHIVFEEYLDLSLRAVKHADRIDLLIWPETMFRDPLREYDPRTFRPPPGVNWNLEQLATVAADTRQLIRDMAQLLRVPLLLGIDTFRYGSGTVQAFNSALAVSPTGEFGDRYDKIHPVMFGEYVPFANRFPVLYRLLPIKNSLSAGKRDVAFRAGRARLAANICFESVLPHVVRGQVVRLRARGEEPDVLANLTNDGWFWGSSELDMHLVCGVFRAVECRKPLVIAANTGFSASIESSGRIRLRGPRRQTDVLIADVVLDGRTSPYTVVGDLFAGSCLAVTVGLALFGIGARIGARRSRVACSIN